MKRLRAVLIGLIVVAWSGCLAPKLHPQHSQVTVVLFDLASGSDYLNTVADGLNGVQSRFKFVARQGPAYRNAVHEVDGYPNFVIDEVPGEAFVQASPALDDVILAFVRQPLTSRAHGSHFISAVGPQRERLHFISTAWAKKHASTARCTLAEVAVYEIVSRLVCEYTDLGFHSETRSCPMDYCRDQSERALGLRNRQFCKNCTERLVGYHLSATLQAILQWREPKVEAMKDSQPELRR
jgi:hypothetical protein